jgi:hypothetical protein
MRQITPLVLRASVLPLSLPVPACCMLAGVLVTLRADTSYVRTSFDYLQILDITIADGVTMETLVGQGGDGDLTYSATVDQSSTVSRTYLAR